MSVVRLSCIYGHVALVSEQWSGKDYKASLQSPLIVISITVVQALLRADFWPSMSLVFGHGELAPRKLLHEMRWLRGVAAALASPLTLPFSILCLDMALANLDEVSPSCLLSFSY